MFETIVSTWQKVIDTREHPSMEEAAEWASFTYHDGTDGNDDPVTIEGFTPDGAIWVFSHGEFIPNV